MSPSKSTYKSLLPDTIIAFIVIILFDFIWLGYVMKTFYTVYIGDLAWVENMNMRINYAPASLVYLFLAFGISFFILNAAGSRASLVSLFIKGALFGFLVYGIYDMTNMATLRHWAVILAAADMAWGTFVCAAATVLTRVISQKVF